MSEILVMTDTFCDCCNICSRCCDTVRVGWLGSDRGYDMVGMSVTVNMSLSLLTHSQHSQSLKSNNEQDHTLLLFPPPSYYQGVLYSASEAALDAEAGRRMLINNTTKKMVVNISSSHISTQFSV